MIPYAEPEEAAKQVAPARATDAVFDMASCREMARAVFEDVCGVGVWHDSLTEAQRDAAALTLYMARLKVTVRGCPMHAWADHEVVHEGPHEIEVLL